MKVPAFHSSNQSDPDVYHDQSDCSRGRLIPQHNRRPGTNGYPRCKTCVDIG